MLDWALGEEIGNVYNRERLKELVKVGNEGYGTETKNAIKFYSSFVQ